MSSYATSLLESPKQFVVEEALRQRDRAEALLRTVRQLAQKRWTSDPPLVDGSYLVTGYNPYTKKYRTPNVCDLQMGEDLAGEVRSVDPIILPKLETENQDA